jgi:1,2-diacylglycerol 3-alpha-glucosyltransferase
MKILHLCLANYYADNYSYQENILPVEHKKLGYDVEIIASTETYNNENKIDYISPGSYMSSEGLLVNRLEYTSSIPFFYLKKKLRLYSNLYQYLSKSDPDIIFIHDVQFLSAFELVKYVKSRRKFKKITVFEDCHADLTNSAQGFISYWILHKLIYRICALALNSIVDKFWGVLPSRVIFLHKMYGIPESKISLLSMGIEDKWLKISEKDLYHSNLRSKYNIPINATLIVTGGRMDVYKKSMFEFMEKFGDLKYKNLYLLVFGSISEEYAKQFDEILHNKNIINFGFVSSSQANEILLMSDLGVFLGRHSVMWEQSVALGLPLILADKPICKYLNHNDNIIYAENPSNAIASICELMKDSGIEKIRFRAKNKSRYIFSYSEIAIKSLII